MKSFQNIKKIKLNQQKEKWNLKNEIEIKKSKLEINQKKSKLGFNEDLYELNTELLEKQNKDLKLAKWMNWIKTVPLIRVRLRTLEQIAKWRRAKRWKEIRSGFYTYEEDCVKNPITLFVFFVFLVIHCFGFSVMTRLFIAQILVSLGMC